MNRLAPLALLVGLVAASCSGGGNSNGILPQATTGNSQSQSVMTRSPEASADNSWAQPYQGFFPQGAGPNLTGGAAGSYAYAIAATKVAPIPKIGPLCNTNTASDGSNAIQLYLLNRQIAAPAAYAGYTTKRTSTSLSTESVADVDHANLLSGLITADAIKAVALSYGTSSGMNSTAKYSEIANIKVTGVVIPNPIPLNFHVSIPLVGDLFLNSQATYQNGTSTRAVAQALQLNITVLGGILGLPQGTSIIIAHAESSFDKGNTCVF